MYSPSLHTLVVQARIEDLHREHHAGARGRLRSVGEETPRITASKLFVSVKHTIGRHDLRAAPRGA